MRICFIEDTPLHGGTQIWVSEAIQYFINMGIKINLICPENCWLDKISRKFNYSDNDLVISNYNFYEINKDQYEKSWFEGLNNADIAICTIHPPRKDFHCSIFASEIIQKNNLKTILIPKTGSIWPAYKREFYLPDERINSKIITITNYTRDYLIENYKLPGKTIELIYQGTDIDKFNKCIERKKTAQKRFPFPSESSPILGCIGSFEERKGQIKLFESICEIKKKFPHVHLLLVGDGPDEKMLKDKIKSMDLEDNITIFPFTNEPVYVFELIDILLLPSLYKEGLPNVILESMAMEIPVIASKMAGIPEIVKDGETGFLTEIGNVESITNAIIKLWSDKNLYNKLRINGKNLMVREFDKKIQFKMFLEHFNKLMEKNK